LNEHPDTKVLSRKTGYYSERFYEPETDSDSICYNYRVSMKSMFPGWDRDDRLDTKDEVLGFSADDSHKAYPVATLRELRVLNDTVSDRNIVIISSGSSSKVRVYDSGGNEFSLPPEIVDDDGFPMVLLG